MGARCATELNGTDGDQLLMLFILNIFLSSWISVVMSTEIQLKSRFMQPVGRQFLPCDALRCTVFVIVILSVCLSVCPSVRPSVRQTRGLCPRGSTYDHDSFTVW